MTVSVPHRIGVMFEYPSINGGENSILAAIDQLTESSCEFVALVHQSGPVVAEFEQRNIPVVQIHNPQSSIDYFAQLRDVIDSCDLQLLHANSLMMGRRLGKVCSQLRVPTTSHLRDIMNLSQSAIQDLQGHRKLLAVSEATRQHYLAQGIDSERISTLHNGVDIQRFQPRQKTGKLIRELGLPDSAILCANVGQICLRKGQNDFAQAFSSLAIRCPDLHGVLIGTRHSTKQESIKYDQQIDKIIESAGLSARFHRLGFRRDMPELFNEIDLLVHTARQEPFGRVLLEAAACERPIVATRVGGTQEMLTDQHSALLVDSGNVEELTQAIETISSDAQLRQRLGRNSRHDIENRFEISRSAARLYEIWSGVIGAR